MRIVISGGSGFVGSQLIPALVNEGHRLLVISRTPQHMPSVAPGCRVVDWLLASIS